MAAVRFRVQEIWYALSRLRFYAALLALIGVSLAFCQIALDAMAADALVAVGQPSRSLHDSSRLGVVLLRSENGGICSGIVIAKHFVLTAAHCVADQAAPEVVLADDLTKADISTRFAVGRIAIHPGYVQGQIGHYDIAVLRVDADLPVTQLPRFGFDRATVHEASMVVGFGAGAAAGSLSILPAYALTTESRGTIFAIKLSPPYPCYGDSGGAILTTDDARPVLVGIVSAAITFDGRSNCQLGAVGTNIQPLLPWIHAMMSEKRWGKS